MDAPVTPGTLTTAARQNAGGVGTLDPLWRWEPIDATRWDKMYPYQLAVVEQFRDSAGTLGWRKLADQVYTLPVPPEALQESTPYAVAVEATLGGIHEEHGGAPFRDFSIRGSFGVLGARASAVQNFGVPIGGGTVDATQRLLEAANGFVSAATNQMRAPNVHAREEFEGNSDLAKSTGYYQALRMKNFLESYANVKRQPQAKNWRLAFCNWKESAVYLVTPVRFSATKQAGSPLEVTYDLQLKAWARVHLDGSGAAFLNRLPARRDPSLLARTLNTLRAARTVVQSATKVANAVLGDSDRLLHEPMREATLLVKDLQGAKMTLADLPAALRERMRAPFLAGAPNPAAVRSAPVARSLALARAGGAEVRQGSDPAAVARTHPGSDPLSGRDGLAVLDAVDVSSLPLPAPLRAQVEAERARVAGLRREELSERRDRVRRAADLLAASLGASDPTFDATYGVAVAPAKPAPTDSDWELLAALNDAVTALGALAATADGEPSEVVSRVEAAAALAARAGIEFRVPRSKRPVPMPYRATLELVAQQYLGDPDRAVEIAALNGLKEPFVDEEGWEVPLLANGADREVLVDAAAVGTRLRVGQPAALTSAAAHRRAGTVVGLRRVGARLYVQLDFDTAPYLAKDLAKLEAYLPDTVSSRSMIYLPDDAEPADDSAITRPIPGVDEFDPMVAAGGVDLLLDQDNDLVLDAQGETRWAVGLQNIIQGVRVALSVDQGALMDHPDYGLPKSLGQSTADVDAGEVARAARRMLASDPTFEKLDALRVDKVGGLLVIDGAVTVTGTRRPVPVAYEVRVGQ